MNIQKDNEQSHSEEKPMGLFGILNKHKMQMNLPTIGEEIKADNPAIDDLFFSGIPVKERKNTISLYKQRTSVMVPLEMSA